MNQQPTTATRAYAQFAADESAGKILRILSTRGVATIHELYLEMDGSRLYYVVAPDGGPVGASAAWAHRPSEFLAWEVPTHPAGIMEAQRAAAQHVLDAALDEVAAEYDLPVPEWRGGVAEDEDPTPCCPDPGCGGNPCTFPGYADNH